MKKHVLLKKIGSSIFAIGCILLLAVSLLSKYHIWGYQFYNILTGSMEPTIPTGSVVVVKQVDPEEIQVNDVITFGSVAGNNLTTHRVIEIYNTSDEVLFQTKGDANDVKDPIRVGEKYLIGKVIFHIQYLGDVIEFVKNHFMYITFLVILVCLFFSCLKNLIQLIRKKE